jgi:hypothetical protein
MAPVLKIKRSSEPGKIPQPADLTPGELALNDADGAIYYKKSDGTIASLSSGATAGTRRIYETTATAAQTTFVFPGGYSPGFLDVWLNGIQLGNSDYVATNGTNISLVQAAVIGDFLRFVAYDPVGLADTYRKSEVDTLATQKAIVMAIALG